MTHADCIIERFMGSHKDSRGKAHVDCSVAHFCALIHPSVIVVFAFCRQSTSEDG